MSSLTQAMSSQPASPKSPLGSQSPWRSRIGSFTLNRRKIQETEAELEIMTENLRSLEVVMTPSTKKTFSSFHPDDYQLEEGDSRSYLDPKSLADPAVKEVIDSILEWINHTLGGSDTRVRIVDMEEDLKDGMVFKLLLEKTTGETLVMPCGDYVQSNPSLFPGSSLPMRLTACFSNCIPPFCFIIFSIVTFTAFGRSGTVVFPSD